MPSDKAAAISYLKFPFYLKKDQLEAVDAWISNGLRGSIIYCSGTGKTEIAFECARKTAAARAGISAITAFNILYLVPRIVLINQNYERLLKYGIPEESIGVYFGERKDVKEITISTYQSIINNLDLIRKSDMVIFDEVHLVSDTAKSFSKIFDVVVEDHGKAILGLTATIQDEDSRYNTILTVLPSVKKYRIIDAIKDGRLAGPIVIPLKVKLTDKEQKIYDTCSTKIKNISNRFKRYDVKAMSLLLKKGGFPSWMAKAWFLNIRKRKVLLSCAENKILATVDLIVKKHPRQRVMVFSETLDSISKLRAKLQAEGIISKVIDSKINFTDRQNILSKWGREFCPLLSVHTLEIGYDVPQVGIEVILATTSNMNQAFQRIGRVIRKYEGKDSALIYVVYVSDTKDDNILEVVRKAIETTGKEIGDKERAAEVAGIITKEIIQHPSKRR
jgi:superfamily II DNA or RNA helicase